MVEHDRSSKDTRQENSHSKTQETSSQQPSHILNLQRTIGNHAVQRLLKSNTSVLQRAKLSDVDAKLPEDFALIDDWKDIDADLHVRAVETFDLLVEYLGKDDIDPSSYPELTKLVRAVTEPLKKAQLQKKKKQPVVITEKELNRSGENLAELEHAVYVMSNKSLAEPLVMGAKGPVTGPKKGSTTGEKEIKHAETSHGKLPPLGINDLEVDSYYLTDDGVLHLDEVKNTPGAFAQKAKDGGQIGRQADWLLKKVNNPDGGEYKKQVGYAVQADGPKFEDVLSQTVIDNLWLIEASQEMGLPFIRIAGETFTLEQLQELYDKAIWWLGKSKKSLERDHGLTLGQAAKVYFSSLPKARETLEAGPLGWKPADHFKVPSDVFTVEDINGIVWTRNEQNEWVA